MTTLAMPTAPAAPLTDHIARLRAAGMNAVAISEASGVPIGTVYNVARGGVGFVHGPTAARLAAIKTPTPVAPKGYRFVHGTRRRTRALARIGHSQKALYRHIDMGNAPYHRMITGRTTLIAVEHHDAICAVYDTWSQYDGDSLRTRTWAVKQGWPGPAAWDDNTIDDPSAVPHDPTLIDLEPDEVLVSYVVAAVATLPEPDEYRPLLRLYQIGTEADQAAICAELTRRGLTPTSIAHRLHTSAERVRKLVKRDGDGRPGR